MHVLESFSLQGRAALVTGGAGLYGRQITAALAEAGALTFIAARNLEASEAYAAELRQQGLAVRAIRLDLADESSICRAVETVTAEAGRFDVLVNNAVTRSAIPGGWEQPMAAFDASLHVNASSLFFLTRLAAQEMKKQRSGSIINVGSYMGLLGPNPSNYLGTDMMKHPSPIYFYEKGGMANFTRFAASVLGTDNIRVNCIEPGGFQSGETDRFVRNYSSNTMLGRMANGSDLKGVVVFLASEASSYITGVNLPVDGGYTAK
ncbi:SDR family NAD(P)-dependent oxidoreductase [Victivallis sp. Marseille-Q1083]|uniref:SDR family NAD(P)-dependent oxidoreductase n=1 Tax=Victivallis sp. Marseille-Q1083 TaxID=2717288 RepID=UPI00158CAA2B|nr:SDR family oxidoreductase [Victivallis sp. Marseille-Q1083]